ncbi:vWA domain-containing protein [Geodermatophilus sp. SYSU D00804]
MTLRAINTALPRRATALLLVCLGAVLALTGLAVPAAAAPSPVGTAALQDLGACLADQQQADVLLLVDESGSLGRTDPDDTRVAAAQLLLARLADTAARSGATVDLAVSGFSAGVRGALDWSPLTEGSLPDASAAVADFAGRDDGFETDYWTALTTARQQLVDHRDPASTRPCQALVLFTDGQYELSARDTDAERRQYGETLPIPGAEGVPITSDDAAAQVAEAGRSDLCRPGGVADQLREDRILLIALGLTGDGVDLGLLGSIAESAPSPCGQAAPYGLFLSADDVQDLVLAFDAVGDPANPPQPVDEKGVCVGAVCPQQAHTFTLDASITSIHLVGTSDAAGIDVFVQPPGVPQPQLLRYDAARPSGVLPAGAVGLDYTWYADGAFSVDASIPAGGANWSGPWRVVFVDPTGQNPDAVTRTQLTIQADLAAVVGPGAPVEWRVGEDLGPVPFALVRSDGTPAALGDPAPTLALDVALRADDGTEAVLATAVPGPQLGAVRLTVPADFPPGPAELRTSLAVTTVSGQVLQPQVRTAQVDVLPPLGFPAVSADPVDFGRLEGTEPSDTVTIPVTGPGCVWVGSATLDVHPAGVDEVTATSPHGSAEECLEVAEGDTGELTVQLESGVVEAGDLRGDLVLRAAPEGVDAGEREARAVDVRVAYAAELVRPADTGVLIGVFLAALVVGIGLPVLVFLLGRRIAAKLPDKPLQSTLLDVRVGPGGLSGAAPDRTWDPVPPPGGGRKQAVLSGVPVRARAGVKLTEAGYAEVEDPARVGVSGAPGGRAPKSLAARLPLALAGSWTLLLDRATAASDAAEVPARLLLVVDAVATAEQREALLSRVRAEGPGAVDSLRAAARESADAPTAPPPPPDPFGGPSGGSTPPGGGPAPDPFGGSPAPAWPGGGGSWPPATPATPASPAPPARDPFAGGGGSPWPSPSSDPFRR